MVFLVCFIDFWCRRTLYWFANTAEEKALSIGEDDGSGPFIWQPEMTGRSAHLGGPLFSFPVVFNLLWFYYIPLFFCVCVAFVKLAATGFRIDPSLLAEHNFPGFTD